MNRGTFKHMKGLKGLLRGKDRDIQDCHQCLAAFALSADPTVHLAGMLLNVWVDHSCSVVISIVCRMHAKHDSSCKHKHCPHCS